MNYEQELESGIAAPSSFESEVGIPAPPESDYSTEARQQQTFKVQLACGSDIVVFDASAPVQESRHANYDGFNIVHLPTDIWAYRNTSGRKFSITAKLVSRNIEEANENARNLDLIRSWLLPDFGNSGATPPILRLSAYRNKNIDNLAVILRSYTFTWPDDVDYIFQSDDPMPVVGLLGIEVDEAYSAKEITEKQWKMHGVTSSDPIIETEENLLDSSAGTNMIEEIEENPKMPEAVKVTEAKTIKDVTKKPYETQYANLAPLDYSAVQSNTKTIDTAKISEAAMIDKIKNPVDSFGRKTERDHSIPTIPMFH